MKIIAWMLTRMLLVRFIFVLFGISIFVITLDIVTYTKEILALRNGDVSAVFSYFLLRTPDTLSTFLPIIVRHVQRRASPLLPRRDLARWRLHSPSRHPAR